MRVVITDPMPAGADKMTGAGGTPPSYLVDPDWQGNLFTNYVPLSTYGSGSALLKQRFGVLQADAGTVGSCQPRMLHSRGAKDWDPR